MGSSSLVRASYAAAGGLTRVARLHESGSLRLRHARGPACEATLINTGGGIVAGDRLGVTIELGGEAEVILGSVAAEKVYGSDGASARADLELDVAGGARLAWLPAETILYGGARLVRRSSVTVAAGASLILADTIVFGRAAHGETNPSGAWRDSWRVSLDGRLVYAEDTLIEGAMGDVLDRPAVGGGTRATGLLLVAPPPDIDRWRDAAAAFAHADPALRVEVGASRRDGMAVARLLARSPERLRAALAALIATTDGATLPRTWA